MAEPNSRINPSMTKYDQVPGDGVAEKPDRQRQRVEELTHHVDYEGDPVQGHGQSLRHPGRQKPGPHVATCAMAMETLVLGHHEDHDGQAEGDVDVRRGCIGLQCDWLGDQPDQVGGQDEHEEGEDQVVVLATLLPDLAAQVTGGESDERLCERLHRVRLFAQTSAHDEEEQEDDNRRDPEVDHHVGDGEVERTDLGNRDDGLDVELVKSLDDLAGGFSRQPRRLPNRYLPRN